MKIDWAISEKSFAQKCARKKKEERYMYDPEFAMELLKLDWK